MLVKFQFPQRHSTKKRSKALRQVNKKVKDLTSRNVRLEKRLKMFQKRNERLARRTEQVDKSNVSADMTPRRKTTEELEGVEVPPAVKQKLIFANAVVSQISRTHKQRNQSHSRKLRSLILASGVVKKYRLINMLHKNTGIRRATLANTKNRRIRTEVVRAHIHDEVVSFYHRADISRCMPGKKDAAKVDAGKPKVQTRILNDYLVNLYARFRTERPTLQMSLSSFCKLRPKNIKLTKFLSRNICLCTIHQNFALKLQCLRAMGINISPHPEAVQKTVTVEEMVSCMSKINQREVAES